MAVVYEATQLSLDRRVALKVLPSESASSPRTSSSAHAPHAYLADFGLVRPLENGSLTCSGATLGTLGYLAPEQLRGGAPSPAADIYALAVVLHECLGRIDASPA